MWHVETDYFAPAVFVIMLIKEHSQRKEHNDVQDNAFYFVLIVSIVNAIIGLTHLAQEEDNIQVIREYLHNIDNSSDFLLGLINDILDMSKIENGELTLKEDTYTKDEFVNSINTVIKPLMDNRDINFVFQIDTHIDCIRVDRLRYNQIFFNLLSNAAKFTPRGGIVEFLFESIPPKDDKVGIRFRVRDNGIGMSPEFLPHLYDPFSQEPRWETRSREPVWDYPS